MRSEVGLASVRSSLGEQPPLRREGISGSHKTPRWREMDSNCWYRGAEWWISATPHDSGVRSTLRWRKKDSNLRSPKRRVLRARDALRSCQGCGTREDPWNGQPLAFLVALRIRSSAFIDMHLSHRRSRAFRPKAPFHAGRRRCRHSTTSVEAELWITDQYFGAANKRDSAIDARGYRIESGKLRGDIISHAVFRVVKPAAGPMARTVGLQTPNDGETAKVPLP